MSTHTAAKTTAPQTKGHCAHRVQAAVAVNLTEALAKLAEDGGPVYVYGPNGKPVAALISVEHARIIEDFEDRQDARIAAEALRAHKTGKEKPVPWEDVKLKAGL